MNFAKSLFSRALLAAALVTGAGAALAGPMYHVDIDTTSFTGLGTGYLDLSFLPGVETGPATATVSHLKGDFGSYVDMSAPGLSGSLDGKLVFDNSQYADLFRSINLGGSFSFDLSFDGPYTGIGGTDFDVSVLNEASDYLLQSVVHVSLRPGEIDLKADEQYASIVPVSADVPEPSAAALVLIGLMMAGAVVRRRA
jgi:hypothetical protein